jgi:hypothetical protein
MWLNTRAFGEIPDVTAVDIDRVLLADEFGGAATLFASEANYIQAGNAKHVPGHPRASAGMLHVREWMLQYGDAASAGHGGFQAAGLVTLDQVRQAFLSYVNGGEEWRQQFTWAKVRRG